MKSIVIMCHTSLRMWKYVFQSTFIHFAMHLFVRSSLYSSSRLASWRSSSLKKGLRASLQICMCCANDGNDSQAQEPICRDKRTEKETVLVLNTWNPKVTYLFAFFWTENFWSLIQNGWSHSELFQLLYANFFQLIYEVVDIFGGDWCMLNSYKHHTNISGGTKTDAIPQKADDKESSLLVHTKEVVYFTILVIYLQPMRL